MTDLTPGLTAEISLTVTESDTASKWGSGLVPVLGTPSLVGLMEAAAVKALEGHLPEGQTTVGGTVDTSGLDFTGYADWEKEALLYLYIHGGDIARHGVEYMLANGIHIEIASQRDSWWRIGRGAWFDGNTVYLPFGTDTSTLTKETFVLSLIIHEALHIEQGYALSHSWEGERLAWQAGLLVDLDLLNKAEYESVSYYSEILKAKDPLTFILILLDNNPIYALPMLMHYPAYPGGQCSSPFCY